MRSLLARHRLLAAIAVLCIAVAARAHHDDDRGRDDRGHGHGNGGDWFSAWTISIGHRMGPVFTGANFAPNLTGQAIRMIVRPSISGNAVRVKIENTQATTAVTFSGAFIGVVDSGASLVPFSNKRLMFKGSSSLTLAPGQGAMSDAVKFDVDAFQRLAVSLDVVSASEVSGHQLGLTTNYMAAGAVGASSSGAGFTPVPQNAGNYPFYYVASVDVRSEDASGTIVTLGDSITDGRCSTRLPDGTIPADQYNRWSDVLARRLHALYGRRAPAVANQGIAGNRVVVPGGNGPAAVLRLDNDVLDRAGLRWVIFYEGTNDITGGATTDVLKAGLQQVIDRVHARGIPVIGATVVPRARPAPMTGWTGPFEKVKLEINHWMHTDANFDAMVEWDALLEGPIVIGSDGAPGISYWDAWNCSDYTHPNKDGYEAMGSFVDLALFKSR
ncbi:MAG TPA: GDSL-type esterase/lipase family protein [Myxococcales bacterium]|nr:GDSL-type esterase/lipase family protein [Myxococcales bacterium]